VFAGVKGPHGGGKSSRAAADDAKVEMILFRVRHGVDSPRIGFRFFAPDILREQRHRRQ
jgi:hypothetical protein